MAKSPKKKMTSRNPASRLREFLKVIPLNQPIIECFPAILGLPQDNNALKFQSTIKVIVELQRCYDEFCECVGTSSAINDSTRQLILSELSSLEVSFCPSALNSPFKAITESQFSLLSVCATLLPDEEEITPDDMAQIRQAIDDLRNVINTVQLSPILRKSLGELIRLADDAIARFEFHGAKALKEAWKTMLGEAAELFQIAREHEDERNVRKSTMWQRITHALNLIDTIGSKVMKYRPLLGKAGPLLIGVSDDQNPADHESGSTK